MTKYTCPCCGYKTIYREDTFYDLCPVCFWETDPIQLADPNYKGGANRPSLIEAQQNFILFGTCEKEDVFKTRLPLSDEPKDENFKTFDETIEGLKYVKRHWDETTGDSKTDDWGTSDYYFEANEKGEILKQIVMYANSKVLKYSNLHIEDEFGGLSEVELDLTESGYKSIAKNTFYNVWNTPIIEKFAKNKLHFSAWHLPVFKEKIIYPNPEFEEDELLITATLDNRFSLDLSYQKGGDHFPRYGFFLLKVQEGHAGVHYFNYMTWDEAVAATQHWINEVEAANKIVDARNSGEAQVFDVRVSIDNEIVMSKITTWRNMDWEVGKYRNIQVEVRDETYSVINTFTDFENMALALQNSLPDNYKIETCFFCRFSTYNIFGNDDFGELICMKKQKEAFLKVNDKHSLLALFDTIEKKEFVNETDYCNEFRWIKSDEWSFKNQVKD